MKLTNEITIPEAGRIEIAKPVDYKKALRDHRASIIEECARVVDIAVCAKYVDLDAIAAAIRSLKDK